MPSDRAAAIASGGAVRSRLVADVPVGVLLSGGERSLTAVAFLVFGLADSLWLLFLSRIIQGLGGGTIGVVQAYVAANRLFTVEPDGTNGVEVAYNAAGGYQVSGFSPDGKWLVYTRRDDDQNSDVYLYEIAAKKDGTVLGLRLKLIQDLGAYHQLLTPAIPTPTTPTPMALRTVSAASPYPASRSALTWLGMPALISSSTATAEQTWPGVP